MIFRVLVAALLGLVFSLMAIAHAEVNCVSKDSNAGIDYRKAIDLLDKGRASDEGEAIRLLKLSIERKCKGAALALAEIYSIQFSIINKKEDQIRVDKLDDQIYNLLDKETELDDGWFEFAMFFLNKKSKYYSIEKAKRCLDRAVSGGDVRAIEYRKDHPF